MKTEQEKETPSWLMQGGKVNEPEFCRVYAMERFLVYQDGAFFGPEGRIADESEMRREIYGILSRYIKTGLSAKVSSALHIISPPTEKLPSSPSRRQEQEKPPRRRGQRL